MGVYVCMYVQVNTKEDADWLIVKPHVFAAITEHYRLCFVSSRSRVCVTLARDAWSGKSPPVEQ